MILLTFLFFLFSQGIVSEKILAVVNGEVITLSEFQDHMTLKALARPSQGQESEQEALHQFIDQRLILQEVQRTGLAQVSAKEVENELLRLKAKFPSEDDFESFMKEHDLSFSLILDWLKHQLLTLKYIDQRIRTFARISEKDARAYYEEHRQELQGSSFEEVRKQIERLLEEREVTKGIENLLKELRRKADIKITE